MAYKDKEKRNKWAREYYAKHPRMMIARAKKYRVDNPEKVKESKRRYRLNHRAKTREVKRKYYKDHRESIRLNARKYYKENIEKSREYFRKWKARNPEFARECNLWACKKRLSTVKGNIEHKMGTAMRKALKSNKAGRRWEKLVGYDLDELKAHLQCKFKNGMTWELFIAGQIHIDHIIPKSLFKYETPSDSEFKQCWGLANLQPLWAKDNCVKHNKCEVRQQS